MELTADAFEHGAAIPVALTCDGVNRSPALRWSEPPPGTASLALIMDDPDARRGTWVHWVLYDLPPHVGGLPDGVAATPTLASGARQGRNDFGHIGYGGPCPPPERPHRYFFRLFAVDRALDMLKAGATRAELERAMQGHVLARAELMGRYRCSA